MKNILEKMGVSLEDLECAAFELSQGPGEKEARKKFKMITEKYLDDINVASLLWAGYLLHDKIKSDMPEIHRNDPPHLVADEILGMSIANYIGGTNAIFNLIRYDTEKPGILSRLDPILDDIVAGLIAGIMTRLYEE